MTDTTDLVTRLREHAHTLDMRPEDCIEWQAADVIETLLADVDAANESYNYALAAGKDCFEQLRRLLVVISVREAAQRDAPHWLGYADASIDRYNAARATGAGGKVAGNYKPVFDAWWEH